jgi:class 3 adenylate cyclase/tetratricopeptide (TPR) repeat protein
MPVCSSCAQENPVAARFCLACGMPLQTARRREARKTVTIVFADLVGSTALGERLDAESVRSIVTSYFAAMRSSLEAHGGAVQKFIGDAVVAAFGIPEIHEDDALRAVRAAVGMQAALATLNDDLERRWGVRLQARIGVNTGEVVEGDPSLGEAFATGDTVNVAARLEQVAAPGTVLLGEMTYRLARHAVRAEAVEPLSLKGKAALVKAFHLANVDATPAMRAEGRTPLIGRRRELAILHAAFERALAEHGCRVVTVVGEAGVGKSRLTREFLAALADRARVLYGRCLPYGQGITYWPIADAVREAAEIGENDAPAQSRAKLLSLLPDDRDRTATERVVASVLGLEDSPVQAAEIGWALRRLLAALAADRPLVLVLDDLQWAEERLLDLVEELAQRRMGRPVLLICLARPELGEARARLVANRGPVTTVTLEPLSDRDSEELAAEMLAAAGMPAVSAARVVSAAQGNPLFLEELVAMLAEDGPRVSDADAVDLADVIIPPTIDALLRARLDRLAEQERKIIDGASVVGEEFWRGAVATLCPSELAPLLDLLLDELVRQQIIHAATTASFDGDDAYAFHHLLMRDAAYRGLLKQQRALLHERFADWLEGRARGRLAEVQEIVGYHLERAYRYREQLAPIDAEARQLATRAADHLAAAGRRALGRGDVPAASALLRRALDLHSRDDPARLLLAPDVGVALYERGAIGEAVALLEDAIELARATGDRRAELRVALERALVAVYTADAGAHGPVLALADEAIPVFAAVGDEVALSRAWQARSLVHRLAGRYGDALVAAREALVHIGRGNNRRAEAEIQVWLGICHDEGPTPTPAAIAYLEEALRGAESNPWREGGLIGSLVRPVAMGGDLNRARRLYQRWKQRARELGLDLHMATGATLIADVEMLVGDPKRAEGELRNAIAALERMGESQARACLGAQLAEILIAQDRDDEARAPLALSVALAADSNVEAATRSRTVAAALRRRRGERSRAVELAREAVACADRSDATNLRAAAREALGWALACGSSTDATTVLREALALYEAKGNAVAAQRLRAGMVRGPTSALG